MPNHLRVKLFSVVTSLLILVLAGILFIPTWITTHAAGTSASEASWSTFGDNPQHTGFNSQEHILSLSNITHLQLDWKYSSLTPGGSSPVIANGVVFAGFGDEKLYALNAKTGTRQWNYYTGSPLNGSPAIANDMIYVSSSGFFNYAPSINSVVSAIDTKTGLLRWSYTKPNTVFTPPTVTNDIVYVASYSIKSYTGEVYALNAQTGAIKWKYATEGGISSIPTVAKGLVYISGVVDGIVYAIDALTGVLKWHYSTGTGAGFAMVANGVVYVSADKLYALNALTGKVKWSYLTPYGLPIVANGIAYIQSGKYLNALDAQKGTLKWSTINPYFGGLLIIANGIIYTGATS